MKQNRFQDFVTSRDPVSAVDPADIRRMWAAIEADGPTTAVDSERLAHILSPQADVLATWLRTGLIFVLVRLGRLERWREGNTLADRVFHAAATFPLVNGTGEVDLDGLLVAIEQYRPEV